MANDSVVTNSLDGIVAHLSYLGIAIAAALAFVTIYVTITPHKEFRLIRQGNSAAAISLGGAILGYTIPLAKAVSQSESIVEMLLWSGVALLAQLLAYGLSRVILPELSAHVDEGKTASSILMAAIAVAIGLLNSAAMTA